MVLPLAAGARALGPARLLRSRSADGERWLVMCAARASVRLNGVLLRAGIRVLRDRDELQVDGFGRVYFSTEQLARVEPFAPGERAAVCPRCKQAIAAGSPAVCCPQCGVWYHQSDEFPCWTYAPRCVLCPQPTALDAGYRWTPEGL
jgi:hypothetical protein